MRLSISEKNRCNILNFFVNLYKINKMKFTNVYKNSIEETFLRSFSFLLLQAITTSKIISVAITHPDAKRRGIKGGFF